MKFTQKQLDRMLDLAKREMQYTMDNPFKATLWALEVLLTEEKLVIVKMPDENDKGGIEPVQIGRAHV